MSNIEIPTDTIRGSIEFFCQDLGAKLLEQSDHFAHIELFDQEILFHSTLLIAKRGVRVFIHLTFHHLKFLIKFCNM